MLFWHFLKAVVTMETSQQGGWKEEHTHGGWGPRVGICPGTQTETSDVGRRDHSDRPATPWAGPGGGAWGGRLPSLTNRTPVAEMSFSTLEARHW